VWTAAALRASRGAREATGGGSRYGAAPMDSLGWQGWYTIGVVALVLAGLIRGIAGPDLVMMAGLVLLAAAGILTPAETFSGFRNPALWAIGLLFIVSAGMRETGALDPLVRLLLGRTRHERRGLLRMCPPLAAMSAFLNNAPIVAMMTPAVIDWARRQKLAASRFLVPLSYATILGSTTTLVGTSVNLTTAGLLTDAGMRPLGFFELTPAGVPIALAGLLYLVLVAPRLLPDRKEPGEVLGERRREYIAAMRIESDCPLAGQTVEEAGLRQLEGLFLVEIDRGGRVITPVSPDDVLQTGDRLIFAGVVATIVELQRIRGLALETEAEEPLRDARERRLIEAVVSSSSPLVHRTIRDAAFRTTYDAAVVAVHRNGERVPGQIGRITLRPGDTLLLQAAPGFLRAHRNSPDFYLVSEVPGAEEPRYEKAGVAYAILAGMVVAAATGLLHISVAAALAVGGMIATRCITGAIARRSVVIPVMVVIGAGLGIAVAMQKTGAAAALAGVLVFGVGDAGPLVTLALLYGVTLLLAETLHHNAAVAIMFPIAVAAAEQAGADPRPFLMGITLAATCAFASPVTYQTHLIVYGPGGYRFTDFVRVGLPLDLVCAAVALAVVPRVWPLSG